MVERVARISTVGFVSEREPNSSILKVLNQIMVETRHVAQPLLKDQHGEVSYGTYSYGLGYVSKGELHMQRYTDSDWEDSAEEKNSSSIYCFSLDPIMIYGKIQKQTHIKLNTVETKYITF